MPKIRDQALTAADMKEYLGTQDDFDLDYGRAAIPRLGLVLGVASRPGSADTMGTFTR